MQAVFRAAVVLAARDQLSTLDRARLQLAMLALLILLAGAIAFVLLMGRWARRQVSQPLPRVRHEGDAWAEQRLMPVKQSGEREAEFSSQPDSDEG
jgi:hypothetical protein